jgi:hypothetical protein
MSACDTAAAALTASCATGAVALAAAVAVLMAPSTSTPLSCAARAALLSVCWTIGVAAFTVERAASTTTGVAAST